MALSLSFALAATPVHAQPALLVRASEGAPLQASEVSVVLLRHETLTVMSIQTDAVGVDGPFALVVPVPGDVEVRHVRSLPADVVHHLDGVSMPRLVERWERDPCDAATARGETALARPGDAAPAPPCPCCGCGYGAGAGGFHGRGTAPSAPAGEVGQTLTRGDYVVTVLAPTSGEALETWLSENGYRVPTGIAETAAPLVASGHRFVIARLEDAAHASGSAAEPPPPLRIEYHEDTLSLPVGFGAIGATSARDLVVQVLARSRYAVPGRSVLAPTGVEVAATTPEQFGGLYASVLARIFARYPGAVLTEHAWSAASCEGCPAGHTLPLRDLATLGASIPFPGGVIEREQRWYGGGFRSAPIAIPRITLGPPEVRGHLQRELVRRTVRRHQNELRFCYEQELVQRPDLEGRVTVAAIVSATGSVQTASIANTTLDNARVEGCVAQAVRRWTFPAPTDEGVVGIVVPITFQADGGDQGARQTVLRTWVLTRLHARLAADDPGPDWTLEPADPIEGGRERTGDASGMRALSDERGVEPTYGLIGGTPPERNRFQTRFVVRHAWEGTQTCASPTRDVWGAPATGQPPDPIAALRSAAPLSDETLDALVVADLASVGLAEPAAPPETRVAETDEVRVADEPSLATAPAPASRTPPPSPPAGGCACRAQRAASSPRAAVALLVALACTAASRRRRHAPFRPRAAQTLR